MIINLARKIQKRFLKSSRSTFSIDLSKQKKILSMFEEPTDLIERSYYQFVCQMHQMSFILKILQNSAAIILIPYFYIKYSQNKVIPGMDERYDAVFISGTKDISYIPNELQNEFDKIAITDYNGSNTLGVQEKSLIKQISKRYWYQPFFCIKAMLKIALYAYQIKTNRPKAVITFGEFSFTSSILTLYCNKMGVEHINIMHGEKLFNIRDSFFQFNRFYVWDSHYVELLGKLRVKKNQFIIKTPKIINFKVTSEIEPIYELTYYLGGEGKKDLENIRKNLVDTKISRNKICVRYHPRYSDERQIRNIFNGFEIENPIKVALNCSISQTKHIVSLYSTVLYQAYKSGKDIIIDDISNPMKYHQLEMLDFIMLEKPHLLLSEVINKCCD